MKGWDKIKKSGRGRERMGKRRKEYGEGIEKRKDTNAGREA